MNQRQLLILSYALYILPIPFAWIGAFIINVMASGYRSRHIGCVKVVLWCFVLAIIGLVTMYFGGFLLLIPVLIWYYLYMIIGLFQALAFTDEVNL